MWDSFLSKNRGPSLHFPSGTSGANKKEENEKAHISDRRDGYPYGVEVKRYSSAGSGLRDMGSGNPFADARHKFGPNGTRDLQRRAPTPDRSGESKNGVNYSHPYQGSQGTHLQVGSHNYNQQSHLPKAFVWTHSGYPQVDSGRHSQGTGEDFSRDSQEPTQNSKCPEIYYSRTRKIQQNVKNGCFQVAQRNKYMFSPRDTTDSVIARNMSGLALSSACRRGYGPTVNLPPRPDTSGEVSKSDRSLESIKRDSEHSAIKPRLTDTLTGGARGNHISPGKNPSIPAYLQNFPLKKSSISENSLSNAQRESNPSSYFITDSAVSTISSSLSEHLDQQGAAPEDKSADSMMVRRKFSDSSKFLIKQRGSVRRRASDAANGNATNKESNEASSDQLEKKLVSTGGADGFRIVSSGAENLRNNLNYFSFVSSRQLLSMFMYRWRNKYEENKSAYSDGGYLKVTKGSLINNRYVVIQKLGWGEFSTVWLAYDIRYHVFRTSPRDSFVALKIAKCQQAVTESTSYEIDLLHFLCTAAKGCPMTRLLDTFSITGEYGSHLCMVMPVHGANLLSIIDQMKATKRQRTSSEIRMIKEIIASSLVGLHELSTINVIHTDIKPENIIATSPDPKVVEVMQAFVKHNSKNPKRQVVGVQELSDSLKTGDPKHLVCLADFGLSTALDTVESVGKCTDPEIKKLMSRVVARKKEFPVKTPGIMQNKRGTLIQTREYRSPEVILGMDFNCQTDVWSIGCTAFELITGSFLLDPKKKTSNERQMDVEHIVMISQLIGNIPPEIVALRSRFNQFYESRIKRRETSPPDGCPLYLDFFLDKKGRFIYADRYKGYQRRRLDTELMPYLDSNEAKLAASFVLTCLYSFDPHKRPTALEMLGHPWLKEVFENKGAHTNE